MAKRRHFLSFFVILSQDREDQNGQAEALVGPWPSPATGQEVCVHNLQQLLSRRVMSRCG